MGFIDFIVKLCKDPRSAIAGWIAMGVTQAYAFIFLIIFIETGVVVCPFLPGDSLLFAAGFFTAADSSTGEAGSLSLFVLLPVVWIAPIVGDQCTYYIGRTLGKRLIDYGKVQPMTPD